MGGGGKDLLDISAKSADHQNWGQHGMLNDVWWSLLGSIDRSNTESDCVHAMQLLVNCVHGTADR